MTKRPPEEANDLFNKLVYKPHERLSLPDRLRCCFWSCLSEAEAPSVTSSARRYGHTGHAARARALPPAHALGQTSEGTVQKRSLLVSGQQTSIARGKLLTFIFWVLGLGRGLKLRSKIGIYATIFMGNCTTALLELMAERAFCRTTTSLEFFFFNLNLQWSFTVNYHLLWGQDTGLLPHHLCRAGARSPTLSVSTSAPGLHLQRQAMPALLPVQSALDKRCRGSGAGFSYQGYVSSLELPVLFAPPKSQPKLGVVIRDTAWIDTKLLHGPVNANPYLSGLAPALDPALFFCPS